MCAQSVYEKLHLNWHLDCVVLDHRHTNARSVQNGLWSITNTYFSHGTVFDTVQSNWQPQSVGWFNRPVWEYLFSFQVALATAKRQPMQTAAMWIYKFFRPVALVETKHWAIWLAEMWFQIDFGWLRPISSADALHQPMRLALVWAHIDFFFSRFSRCEGSADAIGRKVIPRWFF